MRSEYWRQGLGASSTGNVLTYQPADLGRDGRSSNSLAIKLTSTHTFHSGQDERQAEDDEKLDDVCSDSDCFLGT
jgi:hypothetical protein